MGVDPGTNYCGTALFTIDKDFKIISIECFLVDLTTPKYNMLENNLFYRLNKLYSIFTYLFSNNDVLWLASEAGFINRFRPAAYGPIVNSIYTIKKAYKDTTGLDHITEYPPSIVKKVITNHGGADKGDMFAGISGIKEISKFLTGNESEHEIDAMGMAYTCYLEIKNKPEMLLSL